MRRRRSRAAIVIASASLAACAHEAPHVATHGFIAFARQATSTTATAPSAPTSPLPPIDETFPRLFAETRGFKLGTPRDMHPTEDGKIVLFLRAKAKDPRQSLWELEVAKNEEHELLSPDSLNPGAENLSHEERARRERMRINTSGFTSFEATKDGAHGVVTLSGRLFLWTRGKGGARELKTGAGAAIDPHLSPDGSRVAYVRDADIYAIDLNGGSEKRITTGGSEKKTHGLAEFIAQEELDRSRGFWWSPDGDSILYEESDTSKVETLYIQDPAHPERPPDANPYPRAGTANAAVRFGFVSSHPQAKAGATKWIELYGDKYPYIATVTWTNHAPPTIYALDRTQRNGLLFAVDPRSATPTKILQEHDDAWLNVDASVPKWLADGSGFLWSTEKNGAWQLELHDKSGTLTKTLTKPEDGYRKLLAIDSKAQSAYVEASNEPSDQTIATVALDGAGVTSGHGTPGLWESASFGDSVTTYAMRQAEYDLMPKFEVRLAINPTNLAQMTNLLANSQANLALLRQYFPSIQSVAEPPPFRANVEILQVGDDRVRVAIVRPRDVAKTAKIPLIDAAYGGPGYNTVISDQSAYLRAQWIADATGAMVVAIDAQGTPGRGRDWERALANKMGDVPLEGHVAAIEALEKKFPEIDPKRIGIYGWSFGGYLAAYAALKRPDIYRVAVIGAPPADWRDYDTCYTERYLGTPQENKSAYDAASLLTLAEKPPTTLPAAMLIVQGTADDNVYFLNSLKLTSALATGKRPYAFVPIPGVTHQLFTPETSGPIWVQIASFLRDHLSERP